MWGNNKNVFIVKVIEREDSNGTFLKEKVVLKSKEQAIDLYESFIIKYPDFKVECYDYTNDVVLLEKEF